MTILLLILHLIFIAMGTGMSFSNVVSFRLSRDQSGDIAKGLMMQRRAIAQVGDGVITLIWVTGLLLLWLIQPTMTPAFIAKLVAVVLLTLCHFMARRTAGEIMRTQNMALRGRLLFFANGVFPLAVVAIVLAIIAFRT